MDNYKVELKTFQNICRNGPVKAQTKNPVKNLWQNLKVGFHRLLPFSMTETQKMFHLYICKAAFQDGSKKNI